MKAFKTIIMSMLLLAGLTTSCTNDVEEALSRSEAYLKIDAVVDGMTRGAIDATNFTKGDAIGVFVRDLEGKDYNATVKCSNIRARYNGSTWTLDSNVPLENGKEAVVYAYYPYNADAVITGDSIDIDITKQDDVLYGNATGVTVQSSTAKINFKHALARITLAITKGANDVGDGKLTNIRVMNPIQPLLLGEAYVIATEGRMDIKTGTFEASRTRQDEIILNNYLSLSNSETKVDVLLVPFNTNTTRTTIVATSSPYVNLFLTIDGKEYKQIIRNPQWYAGQQYVYPISINRTTDYSKLPADKVDMGIKADNGKTLYWASKNIGASNSYDVGGYYGWGDPTGTHQEQWENILYGNYVKESVGMKYYGGLNPLEDISGTEYDIARYSWAGKWRIPTRQEWKTLMDNCTVTLHNYNNLLWAEFVSIINGNNLIIPLTKSLRIGNTMSERDWTFYWSSTLYRKGEAHMVTVDYPAINYATDVYVGFPIRPVTE